MGKKGSCVFFFFSSRRRHTRCGRDWSSDVCSSDLGPVQVPVEGTAADDRNPTSPFTWALEFGIGIEPTSFRQFASGSGPSRIGFDATTTPPRRPGALLANLSLADVMNAFPAGTDFSAPPSGVV